MNRKRLLIASTICLVIVFLALVVWGKADAATKMTIQTDINGAPSTPLITNSAEYDNGNSGATKTITWDNGNKQKIILTDNCVFTFTQPTSGVMSFTLRVIQDGTGSRTATWPVTVKWPGGTAPTLTTALNSVDIVSCYYNGAVYYCVANLDMK